MQYQICDTIQALSSYLRGVASTAAVLKSAGVGSAEASAMSASITWALRDGIGMLGGLIFSYIASPYFDAYVKEFRLFADLANDFALSLDLCMPYLVGDDPQTNMYKLMGYSALSTIGKVVCGMAAGATKSSITAHFALRGNMADINAKEATQETLVTLCGMTLGVYLVHMCTNRNDDITLREEKDHTEWRIVALFFVLTIVHVIVNYIGVDVLRLRTLNRERAEALLTSVVSEVSQDTVSQIKLSNGNGNENNVDADEQGQFVVPTPEELHESLYQSVWKLVFPGSCGVKLGVRIHPDCCRQEYQPIAQLLMGESYLLRIEEWKETVSVNVMFLFGTKEIDEWRALVHGKILHQTLEKAQDSGQNLKIFAFQYQIIEWSYKWAKSLTSADDGVLHLKSLSKLGWECERLYLCCGRWRVAFESEKDD